jgi:hypothetical protein
MINSNDKAANMLAKERIVGRQLARELTNAEVDTISGGLQAVDYTPTGTPERDCD